jgi:hypothetical protein
MIKDKELKMQLLEKLMDEMDGRVLERDLKPKSKLVVKAEGDNPEEMKDEVVDKLSKLDLPDEEDMAEMSEMSEEEMPEMEEEMPEMEEDMEDEMPMMEEEGEDDYLDSMPLGMKEKLMKQKMMQKNKM